MPLKLARVEAGVWSGKTGQEFEVEVAPAPGGGPFLIHSVCYGEVCLNVPPFRFEVLAGDKGISAVYDWDLEGEFVSLIETDGGENQTLQKRRYKEKEPFQGVLIQGE